MSRMSRDALKIITGCTYGKAQVRWFAKHLGAVVPSDKLGPILTEQTYEQLVARASGIAPTGTPAALPPGGCGRRPASMTPSCGAARSGAAASPARAS